MSGDNVLHYITDEITKSKIKFIAKTLTYSNFINCIIVLSKSIQLIIKRSKCENVSHFYDNGIMSVGMVITRCTCRVNSLDARSRYTDFAQTSLRRQNAVYRWHGMLLHTPEVGIPAARCITASRRKTNTAFVF